jgi:hypothetical protein
MAIGGKVMLEIQKKLAIVGNTYCRGYNLALAVRQLVGEGKLKLVKTVNFDGWRNYEFEDTKSTVTYQDCIEVSLDEVGRLTLEIWDGDSLRGNPTNRRVNFEFEGEWWRIKKLVDQVDDHFKFYCWDELKRREDAERARQAALIGSELLEAFDAKSKIAGSIEWNKNGSKNNS